VIYFYDETEFKGKIIGHNLGVFTVRQLIGIKEVWLGN